MNVQYPRSLTRFLKKAHAYIISDPAHHLDWHIREKIYPSFGPPDDPFVQRLRGWFALLTAERVVRLYKPRRSRNLALRLTQTTQKYLKGKAMKETLHGLVNHGYHAFQYHDEDDGLPGFLSARASYKAALEALGFYVEPFADTFHIPVIRVGETIEDVVKYISIRELPSKAKMVSLRARYSDLASIPGFGDTAALASIAFAWASGEDPWLAVLNPDKSLEFWKWWLDEALATAWQKAAKQ